MKVHIENNIYLESDEYQFLLREYNGKTDKDGRELYKGLGYYPTVESALNQLVKMKFKQSTAQNLQELISEVAGIREDIRSKIDF